MSKPRDLPSPETSILFPAITYPDYVKFIPPDVIEVTSGGIMADAVTGLSRGQTIVRDGEEP